MVKPTKAFPPMAPRPITPPKPKESAPALRFATNVTVVDPTRHVTLEINRYDLGMLIEAMAWVTGPRSDIVWGRMVALLEKTTPTIQPLKSNPPASKKKKK